MVCYDNFVPMQRGHSSVFTVLSVLCLLVIAYAVGKERLLPRITGAATSGPANILGLTVDTPSATSSATATSFMERTIESAKNSLRGKTGDLQKSIVSTIQKEAGDLTKSQLDLLKTQICKDWGVIPASASGTVL